MTLEKDNFTVEFDDKLDYIPEVVDNLKLKLKRIMNFFELEDFDSKIKVIVYNDLESYKKHVEEFSTYYDYICADTFDGNINLLSLEEAHKTKEHANMTSNNLKKIIAHEFVHICQEKKEVEHIDDHSVTWFWESLATNLGNPTDFKKIPINAANEDIKEFGSLEDNYLIAYTIGKYMLENYSHEEILDYIKYPTTLLNDNDIILNNAREWSNNRRNVRFKRH